MSRNSLEDLKRRRFWTALLAEMVGTMLLVLVACGSTFPPSDTTRISLSFGFSVASIVWAIAHVSGGHINPGVSVAFFVTRKLSLVGFLLYTIAQTIGAVIGAALLKAYAPDNYNGNLGTCSVSGDLSLVQGFFIEMTLVFVLVFVVFGACDSQRTDLGGSVPLTVGIAITMCHLWAVPLTGSAMNPARAFGPAVVSGNLNSDHWVYWIGPLIGGALAGWFYDFVLATNATPSKVRGFFTRNYDDGQYDSAGNRVRSNDAEMKP